MSVNKFIHFYGFIVKGYHFLDYNYTVINEFAYRHSILDTVSLPY
jgi:hypothetical protein